MQTTVFVDASFPSQKNIADTPIRTLSSPSAGVAMWLCQLDRPAPEVDALVRTLSQTECARAARFGTELLRRRWIVGRATLRQLLGESLGVEPNVVPLQRGARGRPEIACERGMDFNISHTEGIALVGISRLAHPARIGVDVEGAARRVNADRLALKFLTADERNQSSGLSQDQWRQRFLRLWTCKEAMSKATGDALSAPFGRIDVSLEDGPLLRDGPPPYRPEDWTLHVVEVPPELIATLAIWRRP